MDERKIDDLSVFLISSSQSGAKEKHTRNAIELMSDAKVKHYWDGELRVGTGVQGLIEGLEDPAWDFWMLYALGVIWPADETPRPSWWEHNLRALGKSRADLLLNPDRFAEKAGGLSRPAGG